ncbi:MAG TPA: glycosyltransferase family 4 protein [Pirellulales bacterium]|jgi:glycosyltransferase involved in cell wall biosynthesis|nr:glycosyltransferase family 4 protein [Pirellulales bacterium]
MPASPATKPRVLFVNRSYWPCAEATGQLLTELCEDLAGEFEITVLAGQPNQNPDGHAYPARGSHDRHGVHIRRVWNSRLSKSSLLGKACNLLSYLLAAFVASLRLPRPDAVVVETDPPLLCLLGAFLRWWHGCRLVIYLQDIYPDVAVALGKLPGGMWTGWLRRLFFWTYQKADRVIVLSDDMRALLIASGVEPAKIVSIANWVDTEQVCPVKHANPFRAKHDLGDRFVVMYSGNLGLCQRLEDVLAAARLLRNRPDILWLFVGDGASRQRLEAEAVAHELQNVRFLPYQPKGELAASLSAADVHVVSLDPRVISFLMPSKFYGVLASGTAVLSVVPPECEMARVTRESGVGLVVTPESPAALAEAVRQAAANRSELEAMGARGWQLAQSTYDRRKQTAAFAQMLAGLFDRPVASSGASNAPAGTGAAPASALLQETRP